MKKKNKAAGGTKNRIKKAERRRISRKKRQEHVQRLTKGAKLKQKRELDAKIREMIQSIKGGAAAPVVKEKESEQ